MEDGRRRPGVEDCISGLPDELLHEILRRLRSAPAAARTSALSRRWRRVWAHIPGLVFGDDLIHDMEGGGASFLDAVDAALAAYSNDRAVHVDSLVITVPPRCGENVPASRVAPWLRFASQRLAGAFLLSVPYQQKPWPPVNDELDLPPCEGATRIDLRLGTRFFLRIPPAAMFGALADLQIYQATMDGRELGFILSSSHWPRLQNLALCVKLIAASDISVRSASLRCLKFHALNTRRLDIVAPMLEILHASHVAEARIAAPNLAEVTLRDILGQVVVADAGRRLRLLEVTRCFAMASLMRRFGSVNKLLLRNPTANYKYKAFLDCTKILPKCEILCVSSSVFLNHAFEPSLMHVLRRGNSTMRKLILFFLYPSMDPYCSLGCPCRLPESPMTNKINLDSLQEIEIHTLGGSAVKADQFVEMLKQLLTSMWRKTKLKNLKSVGIIMHFHGSSLSDEQCEKIRGMCPPNIGIKSNVFPEGKKFAQDVSNPTATSQDRAGSEDEAQPMKRIRRPSTRYPPATWTR